MASKSIKAVLSLKDKNFSSNMKKASKGVKSFNRRLKYSSNQVKRFKKDVAYSFKSVAKSAAGIAGAYMGFRALSNGISESVQAAKEQIEVEKKLETILKQRTKATDNQIKSILKLTSAQQQLGIIGDEIQIAGAQQIATFVSNTKSVETLIPAMNNLLAQQKGVNATQQDAVNIGNMIGKVLQGQVGALTRVGITFTKAQESVLKYGSESEKAAMLAKIITDNVGEMNKSLAKTDEGKIQNMKNAWGDYKEEIGKKILPMQAKFAGWFAKKIPGIQAFVTRAIEKGVKAFNKVKIAINSTRDKMQGLKKWVLDVWKNIKEVVEKNKPTFDKIKNIVNDIEIGLIALKDKFVNAFESEGAVWVKDTLLPAITDGIIGIIDEATNLYSFIKDNWSKIEPIVLGIAGALGTYKLATLAVTAVTKGATIATNLMAVAQGALNAAMNMSPIGWISLAIGALITIGVALYKNWDKIKAKAAELWEGIKKAFKPIGEFFGNIWEGVKSGFKSFINFFIKGVNKLIGGLNKIKIKVPDWVPKIGGKQFGVNIPKIPEYALGTSYFKGGLAKINERGGEIVNLPNGSQIIPADKSEKIIEKSRVTNQIIININGTNMTVEEVANKLVPRLKLALANS